MKHLIISLLFPILAWSQAYVGHVDDLPIHLELELYPDNDGVSKGTIDGYYFYDSKLISIPLSGVFNNDDVLLIDGYHYFKDDEHDADEVFSLKRLGDSLIGTLKLKEEIYKVVLTQTEDSPLEDFRNPKLTFVKDSVSNYNNKELVWFHEKYSKTVLFRLEKGFTSKQHETFNPILDNLHLEDAQNNLDCNSWFELSHTIHLVNSNFISFSEHYSVFCGGAHPSHGSLGYTFDLKTLKEVKEIEVLYPDVDFFQLLKEKYYDKTDEFQEECGVFIESSSWNYKQWNLSPKGVILTPSYPHAMTPCEDDYFLSYDEIVKN